MKNSRDFHAGRAASAAVLALVLLAPVGAAAQAPAQAVPAPEAELPAARTIIDRHVAAVGGREAILAISSTHTKGMLSMPANGMSGPIEVFAAKPDKVVTKMSLAGLGEVHEGFDGIVGWGINPMTGPTVATGRELEQRKFDSDFYGELRDPSRFESITTVEQTTFDGRPCYKIRLVKRGGDEDFEFYDVQTGLKAGATVSRMNPMGTISSTIVQTDYKKVGKLLQPMTVKISTMGIEQILTVSSIEYDKVDPKVFELPEAIKALIK